MSPQIDGAAAIVTGAASGMGQAAAERLGDDGPGPDPAAVVVDRVHHLGPVQRDPRNPAIRFIQNLRHRFPPCHFALHESRSRRRTHPPRGHDGASLASDPGRAPVARERIDVSGRETSVSDETPIVNRADQSLVAPPAHHVGMSFLAIAICFEHAMLFLPGGKNEEAVNCQNSHSPRSCNSR